MNISLINQLIYTWPGRKLPFFLSLSYLLCTNFFSVMFYLLMYCTSVQYTVMICKVVKVKHKQNNQFHTCWRYTEHLEANKQTRSRDGTTKFNLKKILNFCSSKGKFCVFCSFAITNTGCCEKTFATVRVYVLIFVPTRTIGG